MLKGLLRCNALVRVALKHLVQEVKAFLIKRHKRAETLRGVLLLVLGLNWQLLVARPVFLSGSASNLEDLLQLLTFVLTSEQGLPVYDLGENAAYTPNIDRSGVVLAAHQNIRGAIPQRDDFVGEVFHWNSKSARQTEIS
jgi:hypothetical protein